MTQSVAHHCYERFFGSYCHLRFSQIFLKDLGARLGKSLYFVHLEKGGNGMFFINLPRVSGRCRKVPKLRAKAILPVDNVKCFQRVTATFSEIATFRLLLSPSFRSFLSLINIRGMFILTGHASLQAPHKVDANGRSLAFESPVKTGVIIEPIGPGYTHPYA